METKVDNSIRKRNSLAVQKRDAWRTRYYHLAYRIKQAKYLRGANPTSLAHQMELEVLQTTAQLMMRDRALLTMELRDSAYKWV